MNVNDAREYRGHCLYLDNKKRICIWKIKKEFVFVCVRVPYIIKIKP